MRLRDGRAGLVAGALLGITLFAATVAVVQNSRAATITIPATPATPTHDPVYRIYLAANGSDANSGLSPTTPLQTLARADELLWLAAPRTDVEVRISQGTYTAPPTIWTFLVPGHTISFLPVDYVYGKGIDGIAGRPVFRGDGTSGFWFTGRLPPGHSGGDAGLRFYYLRVEKYDLGGLALNGGIADVNGLVRPLSAGFNGNTVLGMYFTKLGSKWSAPRPGYGGIDLVNSGRNLILHNHFIQLENSGSYAYLMHGVYLAHDSNQNTVRDNRFETISGDPVRARNDSNNNDISGNVLRRTGDAAQYSDWFCDRTCASRNDQPRECSSHGNVFHDNDNVSGYDGATVPDWDVMTGDQHYAGGAGCSNDGKKRVRTWRNR